MHCKGLDPVKMHTLADILGVETPSYDPIEVTADGVLLPTNPHVWPALATADLTALAMQWANTEEFQRSGWTLQSTMDLLHELQALARRVHAEKLNVAQAMLF